jgi:cell division protein FtsL
MSSVYAEFKRVANSRVARERDGRRGKELLALVAAVLPVAVALLTYTGLHLQTVQVGYEIDRGRRTVARLQEARQKLVLRMAADTNPERAAEFARKANLLAAKPGQVYFVSKAGKP